jgi:hypothetical protein
MKQPHTIDRDGDRPTEDKPVVKAEESKPAAKPVPDKPDGPKEHVAAIRYLIAELHKTADDNAKATLDKISHRVDLLQGKPEAVEDDKRKKLLEQEAVNVQKIRDERAKAAEKAEAKAVA